MGAEGATRGEAAVRRRALFYISGYDPRGPAHYHRLYREEAAKQSAVNGLAVDVGPRRKISEVESSWNLQTANTATDYAFLRYDDLMRERWTKTNLAVLREIARYSWLFTRRGLFVRVLRVSWPMFVTIVYAPALVCLAVIGALAGGFVGQQLFGTIVGLAVSAGVLVALISLRSPLEERITAFWLARILSFIAEQGAESLTELDTRLDRFADRISETLRKGDADEVLIIGHSVGTQLAVSVAARVLALTADIDTTISILTLGQTIPLQSLQPGAHRFRNELRTVSNSERVQWIDVSAAIDSACFPLTDPVAVSGLPQTPGTDTKPKLISARFPKLFRPESYAKIRRQFQRAHFQYLMAAELPGDYDYFLITAGDRTLAERFSAVPAVSNFNRFRMGRS